MIGQARAVLRELAPTRACGPRCAAQPFCLCLRMLLPTRVVRWLAGVLFVLTAHALAFAAAAVPLAKAGVLDLHGWDFARQGIVSLDGQWLLHPNAFDDPREPGRGSPVPVPGPWNEFLPGGSDGFGTYSLTVPCASAANLALSLPVEHSAVRWYVNGVEIASQGEPGSNRLASRPAAVQQLAFVVDARCPLHVVAHVSNFDARRGGLMRSIELGDSRQLLQRREWSVVRDAFVLGALVLLGVMPLIFYLSRRKEAGTLYFGLFCLCFAMGIATTGTRLAQPVLGPLGWDASLRFGVVSWYAALTLFVLFLRSLHTEDMPPLVTRALLAWSIGVTVLTLATPASVFSYLVPASLASAAIAGLVVFATLVRAWYRGRRSARLLLLGFFGLAVAAVHDAVGFQHLAHGSWAPLGVFIFVAAPATIMVRRLSRALSVEERLAIEGQQRADLLMRSTNAGVLDWNAITGQVTVSERYRDMLGYGEGAEPPPFRELVHPDDADQVHEAFLRHLRDRSVRSGVKASEPQDFRMRRRGGEDLWVHAEGLSVCDAHGRTLRFVCSFIDISERKRHEIELDDRAKFIGDLFDSVPLALSLRDPHGRYVSVNRAWEAAAGLRREQVVGRTPHQLGQPDADALLQRDREAMQAIGGPQQHEVAVAGRAFVETRTLMTDARGQWIGVLTAGVDITDKHAAEQALVLERERLRLLVRSTNAGFGDWDAVNDVVTYSPRFKEMLGYDGDADTSGWPSLFEMMHPDDAEKAREQFRSMIRRKRTPGEQTPGEPMSYRLRCRDGSYVWIHAEGISLVDETGRTRRFITSYLDITRLREQEEQLRVQMELTRTEQRRLDLVVRGALVGIVDWDGHTHETYYSPIFRQIRGYAPDADTSDWPDYFRVMIHPDDRERITRRWVTFIKGKGPEGPRGDFYAPEEYRLSRADGSYAWVRVSGMAVRDERDFVVRWIAAVIDVTERRAQEDALRVSRDQIAAQAAQLERQNETLKENVRLREEVERIGRHDIKTPLNSIVAVPRLLREERRLGPEADELLGIVERAGYRILSMVNLSLDLYKMEQGSYIFRPDAVDLADLTAKIVADVRMHAESKQVRIACELDGAPFAWAEELLCYSLLANLLKNAVEASPAGGTVSLRAQAAANGTVAISIHNAGAVPAAIRETFFQKYTSLGKASGTGLGTYSARLMARVQDGDVAMHTSDSDGTTLTVTLRAAAADVMPAIARHAAEHRGIDPKVLASLPPMRVLLVDDDEYNLLIVRRFLPSPTFTVETAINGRAALAAAQAHWPDLVFMDLDMPVMGGLEAVRELRALQRSRDPAACAIVALSSHDDEETRRIALDAGFDRYLTKPVTREVIHQTLLAFTGPGRASVPPPAQPAPAEARSDDPVAVDEDIRPVLPQFMQSRRELVEQMAAAIAAGECDELRRIAHQLAGSFGLYGFAWASEQARWIEKNAAAADAATLSELAAALRQHLDTVTIRFRTEAGGMTEDAA